MPITLNQVQSFMYLVTESPLDTRIAGQIGSSPDQLIILGGSRTDPALNRAVADPSNNKIILAYLDATEASAYWQPNLFGAGAALPSWFGKPNGDFPGLYTVQYWNPAWEPELFARIDQAVAQGYNGVFLDVADGFAWEAGNPYGNPVNPDAIRDISNLLAHLRAYVDAKHLSNPFYLVANNPNDIAVSNPNGLKALDGIFNEAIYYGNTLASGTITTFSLPSASTNYTNSTLLPAYIASGKVVLGNDYPVTTNLQQDFGIFSTYTALGIVPSVTKGSDTANTLVNGPFMFMATPANTTVQGSLNATNFISGGLTASAVLKGGPKGDFFIGGPGHNVITGGVGDDTIYAHPARAASRGMVEIDVIADVRGGVANPNLAVLINGQLVRAASAVNETYANGGVLHLQFAAPGGALTSLELDGSGNQFVDQSRYSNIQIQSVKFQGQSLSFNSAVYDATSMAISGGATALLQNGKIVFPTSAILVGAAFLADTSDDVNGGGGVNTVVYRAASSQYVLSGNPDGSVVVTALVTAEGPDRLQNIQSLTFTDKAVRLPDTVLVAGSLSILREQPFAQGAAVIGDLAARMQSGASVADAVKGLVGAAAATSSVATLSYEFFTGKAPSAAGMDFLVSPTGPNANNLNSAYYQSFSLENRYINFAVNLGKAGEGRAAFTAEYGNLSLFEATRTAYAKIFGEAPSDAKLHAILDPTSVLAGQTLTRADYFAYYGQDGLNGIGTKAAMVGFLLAEAVKADVGVYAKSNDAFFTDVALHNAPFAVDLVGVYNQPGFIFHPG